MEEGHKTEVVLARHLPFISDTDNSFHRINFTFLTGTRLHKYNVDIADMMHKSHKQI